MDSKIKRDGDAIFCFHRPSKEFSARSYRTTKNKINKRNAGATFFSPERGARATSLQTTLEKLLPARSTTRPENRLLLCSVSNNHTDSNHRGLPPSTSTTTSYLPSLQHSPPPKKERTKKRNRQLSAHTTTLSLCIQDPVGPFPLSNTPSLPSSFFFSFCLLYCNHFAGPETCGCAGSRTKKRERQGEKRSYMGTELRLNIY